MHRPTRTELRAACGAVILLSASTVVALGIAANNGQHIPGWWFALAWIGIAIGIVALASTFVEWPHVLGRPRAKYAMEPVVYNEGLWWLRLTRIKGPERVATFRCEVETPEHDLHAYEFAQQDGGALALYPEHFSTGRPLADGTYAVRWKVYPLTLRQRVAVKQGKVPRRSRLRRYTVARGRFAVHGDAETVERICNLLDALKREGERIIDAIPAPQADTAGVLSAAISGLQRSQAEALWQVEATTWALAMDGTLNGLPQHFTPWTVSGFALPGETFQDGARRVAGARIAHLDKLKGMFQ